MKFDINAARSAGYSDDEIAEHLATENKFDLGGALSSGYKSTDIIEYLTKTPAQSAPAAPVAAPSNDIDRENASLLGRYKPPEEPSFGERVRGGAQQLGDSMAKLPSGLGMVGTAISSATRRGDEPKKPAQQAQKPAPQPTPYRDRREALDDAVNLLEEGYDKNNVAESFAQGGITFDDIVAHGQKRGSDYFKQQPAAPVDPEVSSLARRFPAPVTGEMKGIEPTAMEEVGNLVTRGIETGGRTVDVVRNRAGLGMSDEFLATRIAQRQRRIDAARPGTELQDNMQAIADAGDKGLLEAATAIAQNPTATLAMIAESVIATAPAAAASIGGFAINPLTGIAASFGAGTAMEYGATIVDTMIDAGMNPSDPASVARALANPELMAKAEERGLKRGLTVGAFSALTAGVATRFAKPILQAVDKGQIGRAAGLAGSAGGIGIVGDSVGEAAAQTVVGDPLNYSDILIEGLAGGPGAVADVGGASIAAVRNDPMRQIAREIDGTNIQIAGGADARARALLDPNAYDPTLVSPVQTMRQAGGVGPNAPTPGLVGGAMNFTTPDSPSAQAGLVPIVVPNVGTGDMNVSTLDLAGPTATAGGQLAGDLGGTGLGDAGLAGVDAGGIVGAGAGGLVPVGGTTAPLGSADGKQPASVGGLQRVAERASDEDLLARTQAAIVNQEINNDVEAPQPLAGRRGEGYATEQDAEQGRAAAAAVLNTKATHDWRVEPMGNGRFHLVPYRKQQPADQTTQAAASASTFEAIRKDIQPRLTMSLRRYGRGDITLSAPAPELESSISAISTVLGSTLGMNKPVVVGFADAGPTAPNGFEYEGTAFVNLANIDVNVGRTSLHEFRHVVERIAAAESSAGLTNTPAQQFTASMDSIFDDIPEVSRRAYLENYLRAEELRSLYDPRTGEGDLAAREARIKELLDSKLMRSEMVADFMGNRALDRKFLEDLAEADPEGFSGFVQKWIKIIDNLIATLRGAANQSDQEAAKVDQYVRDLNKAKMVAREALIAYRKGNIGQQQQAAQTDGQAAMSRRGAEQVGDFEVRTMKDGTAVVYGDPDAIRAQIPEDVKGRVTKDGIVFTTAAAARVKAALGGRTTAYSREGAVLDKLPMRNGKYLGAPSKFDTPGKIPTLRKILRQLADEGAPGRYWYENSGKEVLKMVGGDVQEARKFVALLAIYSPQAKVDANSTFALRAWAQYKAGQPISVKTGVMDSKAKNALDDVDAFWSGEKTGNFFFNLLREIDPSTAGKQGATIDMWMMRAGQYDTDAPTSTQYAFMENETNRLASELGWEPQQVQAAIWVAMKARMENSGVKKMTEASSEKKKWIKFVPGKDGKGKVRVILDEQKHRDNWLKYSFAHDVTKDDTQQAKFDFGDGLKRHIGQVSFEARPGRTTSVLPGIHSAPYAQQVEFQQAVQRAFLDNQGNDLLAMKLGLLVDNDILAPGVWQGEISPSTQLGVAMAPAKGDEGKTSVDPSQAKALNVYAAVAGLVARQEGVGWHRPFYSSTKRDANGLDIDVGRVLNPREVADLETAVGQWMVDNGHDGWQDQFAFVSSPNGIRVVNFGIITNEKLHSDIVRVAESVLPDFDYRVFASSGDMPTNNWKENQNGESYVQRIGAEGRSDVLDWARAYLAPRVQRVFNDFSERYDWGDAGEIKFSTRDGGREGGRSAADGSIQAPERAVSQEALSPSAPLPGAPRVQGFTGPDPRLVAVAEQYARDNGITLRRQAEYIQVDPERAARIAEAYDAMPHAPNDLRVKAAYKELTKQVAAQYRALEKAGYKFWFMDMNLPDNQEYASSPWNAMRDIRATQTMGVFPTADGFGSGEFDPASNPMLEDTGIKWPSGSMTGPLKRVLANDLFRAVHDAFGHGLEGAGFREQGEENAWQAHVRLFKGKAVAAITSETRGQNSWLNYGPNGEANRNAKVEDTVFADQKTGLMPEWTWTEGVVGDMPAMSDRQTVAAAEFAETKAKFEGTDQWLKAPNGQRSNLNQRQWIQVRTPSFKAWFGDWENDPANASKVIDDNGEPQVYYHGSTKAGFTEFNVDGEGKTRGTGAFFADNAAMARGYSGSRDDAPVYRPEQILEDPSLIDGLEVEEGILVEVVTSSSGGKSWEFYTDEEAALEDLELDEGETLVTKPGYRISKDGYELDIGTKDEALAVLDGLQAEEAGIYSVFLNARDMVTIDWQGNNWDDGPKEKVWRIEEQNGDFVDFVYSQEEADALVEGDPTLTVEEDTLGEYDSTDDAARQGRDMDADATMINDVFDTGPYGYAENGNVLIVYKPENIKSADVNSGEFNPANADIRYSQRQTETPAFKRWSNDAPVIELGDDHEFRSGESVVVEALHGTTNADLTTFKRERANIESDMGAGFYASNTPEDVATNYANVDGPDLTQRVELLAERLEDDFDGDMDAAREEARKRLSEGAPNTMKLFIRFNNPVVIGGRGETFLDYNEPYNEETDEYGEPTGSLADFVEALREVAPDFNVSDREVESAIGKMLEQAEGEGIKVSDAHNIIKRELLDAYDDEGNSASNEVFRQALSGAGFDGVIDTTVNQKFGPRMVRNGQVYDRSGGMKGMNDGTVHFIAFNPTQIKSATGNQGTFDPENPDIRYSDRQTDTPAFKKWFGDSQVVDEQGRPRVMYHGTGFSLNQFMSYRGDLIYFATTPEVAKEFADSVSASQNEMGNYDDDIGRRSEDGGASIYPVYLSAQNIFDPDNEDHLAKLPAVVAEELRRSGGEYDSVEPNQSDIKAAGFDGVYVRERPDVSAEDRDIAVFSPTQIKSAIGNSGEFDGTNPDIRLSQRATVGQNFTLPSMGKVDVARRALQDDSLRMKRVIEAVKAKGGVVGEAQNFYNANTLMPGRIQAAMDEFKDNVIAPLAKKAAEYDIDFDELALYAYAKHARERNYYIASINKRFPDGGSGMKSAEANRILKMVAASGKQAQYDDMHGDLMAITATTRQTMLIEGLITQEEFDQLENAYEFYIPLRGLENVDEESGAIRPGIGRGVNVRGNETLRALGRKSRASDLIENAIRDYQRVITRVEKNDVGKVLLDFVLSNPDPDLWGVDVERSNATFNKTLGAVQYTKVIEKGEDTIGIKVGGQQVYIKFADKDLTRALRQAWKDEVSGLERATMAVSGWWNNWLRGVLTRYNPVFAAINIPRDALWSGTTAALADLGPKGLARYLMAYGKAMMASSRQEAGISGTSNKLFGNPVMDKMFQEFRAAGGVTGGFYMKSLEDINADLRKQLLLAGANPKSIAEIAKNNLWNQFPGMSKALQASGMSKVKANRLASYISASGIARTLEFLGSASENATRFALYMAAREVGKTPVQAGLLAKDGTTNFNRKGEWGGALNNMYLFFNAAVQGTSQLLYVLKKPQVQAAMAGVASVGFFLAAYGAAAGGEDDDGEAYWDKIPSYVKERNLVIMLPPGDALGSGMERAGKRGRYILVPVQYGFNIFPNIGYMISDVIRNQQDPRRGLTPTKAALHMTSVVLGSLNPFGGAVDLSDGTQVLLALAPTLADLPIQLSQERNTFGSPSAPDKSPWDVRPDSSRMFTSQMDGLPASIAETLNELGGGNEAKPGSILGVDTSITPGTIQTVIAATTGGLGNFVEQMTSSMMAMTSDSKDLKAARIPFVNRFYGEVDEGANIGKAGDRMRAVRSQSEEIKAQFKLGLDPELDDEDKRIMNLAGAAEAYQKHGALMRKQEIQIIKDDSLTKAEKDLQRKQLQVERDRLATEINRLYIDSLKQQK